MTRMRRYGPWPIVAFASLPSCSRPSRCCDLVADDWHRKMWLLWAWENVPDDKRSPFAQAIAVRWSGCG